MDVSILSAWLWRLACRPDASEMLLDTHHALLRGVLRHRPPKRIPAEGTLSGRVFRAPARRLSAEGCVKLIQIFGEEAAEGHAIL